MARMSESGHQHMADMFAATYKADTYRGYGYAMHKLLSWLSEDPRNWSGYVRDLFEGLGSVGNGAAIRVAPLGAFLFEEARPGRRVGDLAGRRLARASAGECRSGGRCRRRRVRGRQAGLRGPEAWRLPAPRRGMNARWGGARRC